MKKLIALLSVMLVMLAFPVSASAMVIQSEQGGTPCYQRWLNLGKPLPYLCATESINLEGDKLILTASSDLANLYFEHTPPSTCSPKPLLADDNWDQCISSTYIVLGPNDSICLYKYDNYSTKLFTYHNSDSSGNDYYTDTDLGSANDQISSIRLNMSGASC